MTIVDLLARQAYQESYPPTLWTAATGATAGIPGSWTPAGRTPPASPADLAQGKPNTVKATPSTPWTSGQYVQTGTAGAAGRATWTGTAWVSGAAPLDEPEPPPPAPEPDPEPPPSGE